MAYSPKYASSQNAFDKLTGLLKEIDKYCNG
jgi:hypothetical protein